MIPSGPPLWAFTIIASGWWTRSQNKYVLSLFLKRQISDLLSHPVLLTFDLPDPSLTAAFQSDFLF